MTMPQTTPVCPRCGGRDLVRDGAARWSDENQRWELSSVYDAISCDDCAHETDEPDWIDSDRDASIYVFKTSGDGALKPGWWVRAVDAPNGLIGPLENKGAAETESQAIETRRDRLFNCCADELAPDWSPFRLFTIGGCKDDSDDPGHTIGLCSDDEAEFWTVYAQRQDNGCEAITDCKTRAEAESVAAELSALSGLPIGSKDFAEL